MEYQFTAPTNLTDVLETLEARPDEVSVLAGGAVLSILTGMGMLGTPELLSLARVPELRGIRLVGKELVIGAQVTHREMERNAFIRNHAPLLSKTYGQVASVRLRNQATVGGNLATADYASDPPTALIALGASVRLRSLLGDRLLRVQDFILGHYMTAREPNELLTEVCVPLPAVGLKSTYLKYKSRSSEDRPCCSVAVTLLEHPDRTCASLRVVVGAAADAPYIDEGALNAISGKLITPGVIHDLANCYADGINTIGDFRGSAWYRRELTRTMVARALEELTGAA